MTYVECWSVDACMMLHCLISGCTQSDFSLVRVVTGQLLATCKKMFFAVRLSLILNKQSLSLATTETVLTSCSHRVTLSLRLGKV